MLVGLTPLFDYDDDDDDDDDENDHDALVLDIFALHPACTSACPTTRGPTTTPTSIFKVV